MQQTDRFPIIFGISSEVFSGEHTFSPLNFGKAEWEFRKVWVCLQRYSVSRIFICFQREAGSSQEGKRSKELLAVSLRMQDMVLGCGILRRRGRMEWLAKEKLLMLRLQCRDAVKFKVKQALTMNFSARIKSAKAHPQYVLNVSIDIPLKSKYAITHRSQGPSLTPSAHKLKRKFKVVITPITEPHSSLTRTQNTSNPVSRSQLTSKPVSRRQDAPLDNGQKKHAIQMIKHSKNRSQQITNKHKPLSFRRQRDPSKTIRNISVLEEVQDQDDNIIKYTSNSSELKRKDHNIKYFEEQLGNTFRIDTCSSQLNLVEIRAFEAQAQEKKFHLDYDYGKEKFILMASVKKIQRAWRNYMTRKLVKSYSTNIHLKQSIAICMQSARSAGGMRLKKADLRNEVEKNTQEGEILLNLQKLKEDSIRKWDDLAQQIKAGKDINTVLQNSWMRREQLKTDLKKINQSKNYYDLKKDQRSINEEEVSQTNTEKRRNQRMEYFENEILRIDNDLSESSSSLTDFKAEDEDQTEKRHKIEELETQKLRKKLELFNTHIQQYSEPQEKLHIPMHTFKREINKVEVVTEPQNGSSEQNGSALTHRDIFPKEFPLEVSPAQQSCSLSPEFPQRIASPEQKKKGEPRLKKRGVLLKLLTLNEEETSALLDALQEELAYEVLIQYSESQSIVASVKRLFEDRKAYKKPEGISTNISSIRDYIQNFANYINDRERDSLLASLSKSTGPTPQALLKYLRNQQLEEDEDNEFVMTIQLFNNHWEHLNELIYFDPKYPEDSEKEAERVFYLKQLTKVFFRAIFDSFNEALEHERTYGLNGKPYPWSRYFQDRKEPSLKDAFRFAYRRVMSLSVIFCGTHFEDKRHNFSASQIEEMQQENLLRLLKLQLQDDEYRWWLLEDERAEVRYELAQFVEQELLDEIVLNLAVHKVMV